MSHVKEPHMVFRNLAINRKHVVDNLCTIYKDDEIVAQKLKEFEDEAVAKIVAAWKYNDSLG